MPHTCHTHATGAAGGEEVLSDTKNLDIITASFVFMVLDVVTKVCVRVHVRACVCVFFSRKPQRAKA